jgi:acetyl/propionyl-CoA carboxylase alpha subunit/acetyl-CoA carboxylase carboxyltransferase component
MGIPAVLVANRGEIAIRVFRAAADLGIRSVAVYGEDDEPTLHVRRADEACPLPGSGPAAYLDIDAILTAAGTTGCAAIHPGYGFLSENAAFARRCAEAGITFIGPGPETLELFGDKSRARALATELEIPVLPGTPGATSLERAREFLAAHGPVMVKALAGGGGRGMRPAADHAELDAAFERCESEARAAFGSGELYVELLLPQARHIEVQVVGDGQGGVAHLWERDCSIQRGHQKIVEVAPSPELSPELRLRLTDAAVRMAEHTGYRGLCTIEFLVDGENWFFLEANPRLQVEHTVTEEITGIDLVRAQLRIADGATLLELGLRQQDIPAPRGFAVQARVNTETLGADGTARPASGTLTAFEPPSGPGVRVDTHGYPGYQVGTRFDSLLAKVITHSSTIDFPDAVRRARRALREFTVTGPATNLPLLNGILEQAEFAAGQFDTGFVTRHLDEFHVHAPAPLDSLDAQGVLAPIRATVLRVPVAAGDTVRRGDPLVVLEAMKMEHVVGAPAGGVVRKVAVAEGELTEEGSPVVFLDEHDDPDDVGGAAGETDLDAIPPGLAEVTRRHEIGLDAARPEAVERRHARGHRTARENLADLCDPGTFLEYGALTIAAQRRRRTLEELVTRTPADGLVSGIAQVNGSSFGEAASRCAVLSYDYTVLAGTQGHLNHVKTDRMFAIAAQQRLPVVLFAEGGGGRPGDTDTSAISALTTASFHGIGRLSGLVPLVGITAGRCFAGNAALLGSCDVVIATRDSSIGMGGPAMIEGGGLGTFTPDEVGPSDVQWANGVIDVLAEDEAEAVDAAKRYLSYFQGSLTEYDCADQRELRHVVPENRRRIYDIRTALTALADTDSVLELRRGFAPGAITALIRVAGRPLGVIANNPAHLGGAIDRDAADKMARFLQLCEAFALPVVSLCDTPGFMVGPDAEKTATVRHFSRLFVTGANLTVPVCTVILRKAYGLGAQAMAAGAFHAPAATISWPTGEVGAMGLEGAVRLGHRRELNAIEDPAERQREFDRLVENSYEQGKALNAATVFEIDDVIDPAETRHWISGTLGAWTPSLATGKRIPFVDTW